MSNRNQYKLSFYNVLFSRNSKNYIWNTFSGALLSLSEEGLSYIQNYSPSQSETNTTFSNILLSNGCIVNENYDELKQILADEKSITMNANPPRMYFTITPIIYKY